jgi:antitoxin VapB
MNLRNWEDSAMSISIKDSDTDAKIRELAALTGESITEAVRLAIEQRLRRESSRHRAGVAGRLVALGVLLAKQDKRVDEDADGAIGYDVFGLPT